MKGAIPDGHQRSLVLWHVLLLLGDLHLLFGFFLPLGMYNLTHGYGFTEISVSKVTWPYGPISLVSANLIGP